MVRQLKLISGFSIILLLFLFTAFSQAQTKGIIVGSVVDSQSGEYLPGANVMLEGTNIGASTDKDGSFRVANVTPGNYVLIVKYIGYKPDSTSVTVRSGVLTNVDIKLSVSYVSMKDVVVEGLRQGQVKALSIQRESNKIENVVSREQMENFPDANAADVLQRIPGVFIERSGGEGRYVLIRGTEPRLTSVTVNGDPLATNRNQERYTQMDIIGSNQMSMIEVVKAITPDMSVNSIGGAVNITTRSPFDYPGTSLKVTAGSGYTNLGGQANWKGSVNYSTRFGADKKLGLSVTANWDQRNYWEDGTEFEWGQEKDVNKNVIPYALEEFDLLDYQWQNNRYGLGGTFEYRPNDNGKYYVKLLWSDLDDREDRSRTRVRVSKGDYLNPEGTLTQKSRIVREIQGRPERQIQSNFSVGGENHFGDLSLDYNVGYSYGVGTRLPQVQASFDLNTKVNLALDYSNSLYPKYTVTNKDNAYMNDAANYESSDFSYRDFHASNNFWVGGFNLKYPYDFFGNPSTVKGGVKYTRTHKDNGDTYTGFSWEGNNPVTLGTFQSGRQRNDFMNGNYQFGPEGDAPAVKSFILGNWGSADFPSEPSIWDAQGQTYTVTENITAYYLMTTIHFGKLSLLAGFRQEFTGDDYNGNKLVYDTKGDFAGLTPVTDTRNYNNLFPMVHLIYHIGQSTKARLAFTKTMSRPNYWDLVPYIYLRDNKESIRSGNPSLVPTYADNYDFIINHYFSGIGVASASFFYKSLKNIIFTKTYTIQSGTYAGYENEQPVNGGDAKLYGFELDWQQQLTFLPGFLSGFGIYANYTHTWANADLTDRAGFLPGQAGDVGNLALSYEMGGFNARLSFAYQGKFITEVGINEGYDFYTAPHGQLDFTASQKIFRGLGAYLEVVNINNEPDKEYMGDPARPTKTNFLSWWSRFGLKYNL